MFVWLVATSKRRPTRRAALDTVHFLIAIIHVELDLPVKRSAQHSERSGQIDPGNRLAGSLLE
ncbi:hypothetical protein RRU01S_31_00130 [Agrobacterium rubi TR3 = NBRC 13261]|uniref:Uncharacterized protein n=1 Tax=Agrobacterium rubi TR3 = NBRC 13261 TaxID=1368415 RepID=A0A081D2D3_9HYPH|nr:hypothetical protein RRU01S_31_00130 [Agrobacterium rubi TR3 = NBRC 13261]